MREAGRQLDLDGSSIAPNRPAPRPYATIARHGLGPWTSLLVGEAIRIGWVRRFSCARSGGSGSCRTTLLQRQLLTKARSVGLGGTGTNSAIRSRSFIDALRKRRFLTAIEHPTQAWSSTSIEPSASPSAVIRIQSETGHFFNPAILSIDELVSQANDKSTTSVSSGSPSWSRPARSSFIRADLPSRVRVAISFP